MAATTPRVSIGLPVYNGGAFLEETLESLLGQTYRDFELILSDNASTDATESICRKFVARDSRVTYHRQEKNLGAVPNFNRVFELSKSEYFRWAAHDDLVDPSYLGRCVELLDNHPEVVWCHSRSTHIDPSGQPVDDLDARDVSYATPMPEEPPGPGQRVCTLGRDADRVSRRFLAVLLGSAGCLDAFGLIRSEVLRKTGLYEPYFGWEKVLVAELALQGPYREIPDTLFFVRVHPEAAGNLRTANEQRVFIGGSEKRRLASPRLNLLRGYVQAVCRADLTLRDRAGCFGAILRYLFQVNKWKGIVAKACTGRGLGEDTSIRRRLFNDQEKRPKPGS